jgi:hypothetical protein
MRLFPIQLARIPEDIMGGKPEIEFENSVWEHRPTLILKADTHGILTSLNEQGLPTSGELLAYSDVGLYFARIGDARVVFDQVRLFFAPPPKVDEFPNEKDGRHVYHLPKYWTYGTCNFVFALPDTKFWPNCPMRIREARI